MVQCTPTRMSAIQAAATGCKIMASLKYDICKSGEAVLAAQLAVWELTNQGKFTVNEYLRLGGYGHAGMAELSEKVTNADVSRETDGRFGGECWGCTGICAAPRPAAPGCETVSDATLQNPVYTAVKESDGSYAVTVRVDVQTTVGSLDALTQRRLRRVRSGAGKLTEAEAAQFPFPVLRTGRR